MNPKRVTRKTNQKRKKAPKERRVEGADAIRLYEMVEGMVGMAQSMRLYLFNVLILMGRGLAPKPEGVEPINRQMRILTASIRGISIGGDHAAALGRAKAKSR